jgi:hypothetical protein
MHLSLSRKTSRLPKRFPIGTTYVVEGHGGEDGNLRVFSRYLVLPNGQRINLGADLGGSVASRARRARSRGKSATPNTGKGRAPRPKKISANAGTSRRHGR